MIAQSTGLTVCVPLPATEVNLRNYRNNCYPFCSWPARALLNVRSRNLGSSLHFRKKEAWCTVCIQNYQSYINLLTRWVTAIYLISFLQRANFIIGKKWSFTFTQRSSPKFMLTDITDKNPVQQPLFQINFSTFFSAFMTKRITPILDFLLLTQVKISTPIYLHPQ